jgi:trehalose 6-phosphate synthase
VDQALEARIEWDRFTVNRQHHLTHVRGFPISVAFPENHSGNRRHAPAQDERAGLLNALGAEATFLGVGVDRVDYTKGILERFRGIERFLESFPEYQHEFTFIQIGAPSRFQIRSYQVLLAEVAVEAKRINDRFQAGRWKPIVYLQKHHSHEEIERYYRAADLCMVTSLHDGMNLVAKEFIAARDDDLGVLILSVFTGASRELGDALQVNPYDVQQLADTICAALKMRPEDQKMRMRRMRRIVREHNVYRWAGNLVSDLCELRVESEHAEVA